MGKSAKKHAASSHAVKARSNYALWFPVVGMLAFVATCAAFYYGFAYRQKSQELSAALQSRITPDEAREITLPAVEPELLRWLAMPDSELEKADVLELNLLVAKGLPECQGLDIAACKQQLDHWANEVRKTLADDPMGFEREKEKWGTRLRFELTVMGSVLMEDHQVRYVEKLDHCNADHKFAQGVLKSSTGSCATLPVVWAALGQRLGYPIKIALAPGHLYCVVNTGAEKINIETTASAHLSMNSDEKIRQWCPDALVKDGTFMRPLSNRELIGLFLMIRGEVWGARLEHEKSIADMGHAFKVIPWNTNVVATMAAQARTLQEKRFPGSVAQQRAPLVPEHMLNPRWPDPRFDVQAMARENKRRLEARTQPTFGLPEMPSTNFAEPYQPFKTPGGPR